MVDKSSVAIIGGGASGCVCAYFLLKAGLNVTIFDKNDLLRTLLPTGGGRCNLAHAEYDFKELVKNYPRGEKFLYSVFSKFATSEACELFNEFGIKTYTQEDGRIFPESNSAKDVRNKILKHISNVKFVKTNICELKKVSGEYEVITISKEKYRFKTVIIAIGGHSGYDILKDFDINIIPPKPSLVGLNTVENLSMLSGISAKNVECNNINNDLLFTHFGVSGPLAYKISSINAFKDFPYQISLNLYPNKFALQDLLNKNPQKAIINVLSILIPHKLASYILNSLSINIDTKAHLINGIKRDAIQEEITNFTLTIKSVNKGEETVTAGGIDLDCIDKNMQFKKYPNLYAIGEVLNIDGFCGGFNLQNAWSNAYVAAQSILSN